MTSDIKTKFMASGYGKSWLPHVQQQGIPFAVTGEPYTLLINNSSRYFWGYSLFMGLATVSHP